MKLSFVLIFLIISDIFGFEDDFRSQTIDRFPNGFPKEDFREMESQHHVTFMSSLRKRSKIRQRSPETEDVVDLGGGEVLTDQPESTPTTDGGVQGGVSTVKPEYEYEYVYEDVTTEGGGGSGGGFMEAWNKRREEAGTITTTSTPWWRMIFNIATAPIVFVGELFNVPGFRKIKSTSSDDYFTNGTVIMRVPHKRSGKGTKSPVKRRKVRRRVRKTSKEGKEGKGAKSGRRSVGRKTTKKPRNYRIE